MAAADWAPDLLPKPGILPPVSPGQICQGALKFLRGAGGIHLELSSSPFPGTSFLYSDRDPRRAPPFLRLVRTLGGGVLAPAEALKMPRRFVKGARPTESLRLAPAPAPPARMGLIRSAALGAVQTAAAAAPLGLRKVAGLRDPPTLPRLPLNGDAQCPSQSQSRRSCLYPLPQGRTAFEHRSTDHPHSLDASGGEFRLESGHEGSAKAWGSSLAARFRAVRPPHAH